MVQRRISQHNQITKSYEYSIEKIDIYVKKGAKGRTENAKQSIHRPKVEAIRDQIKNLCARKIGANQTDNIASQIWGLIDEIKACGANVFVSNIKTSLLTGKSNSTRNFRMMISAKEITIKKP